MNRNHFTKRKILRWLDNNCIWIIAIVAVIICTGIYFFFIAKAPVLVKFFYGEICDDELTNAGVFGDSAGVVNALFSALAFIGVIIAIVLQAKELKLQRIELQDTRKELAGQKHEFEIQNETLKRQRFENTFFQMLNLQQDIVADVCYKVNERDIFEEYSLGETISGRMVFQFFFLNKHFRLKDKDGQLTTHIYKGIKNLIVKHDISGYEQSIVVGYFDHYFRHLYHIVKFIDETDLLPEVDEDKVRAEYIGIVRSQLSKYELVFLFYNCLSISGKEKFKPLVEKYSLLKNLREELLVKKEHKELYNTSAFEKKS